MVVALLALIAFTGLIYIFIWVGTGILYRPQWLTKKVQFYISLGLASISLLQHISKLF